ncbi:MAG TPA: ABC transporter permease [Bacteroidales bacterium]|nr:ABC transporter permease [Bacteroidales bacterium]
MKEMLNKAIEGAKDTARIFTEELKLIFTDAGAVLMFVIALFIYPLLYATAYEKEIVKDIPVAVVDLDHTSTSRQYSRMADATEQIHVISKPASLKEAEQMFYDGKVKGVVLIPADFEKDILSSHRTSVSVYCDASYFLYYKQVFTGASYANSTFSGGVEIKRMLAEGKSTAQALDQQEPLKITAYNLYNPSGGYGSFVMPGMILVIIQQTLLIGIGMLGGTIREKNMFLKMSGRAKYRLGSVRLVFGKSAAYTFVYLFNAMFALGVLHRWFSFPANGNFWAIITILIPYILSVSFLGLAVSMFFEERVHSMLFMVFLSPMVVFLSGISWPTSAISPVLYGIAHIFPSTVMIPAYLKVRIAGATIADIRPEYIMMLIQMVAYFILAITSYRLALWRFGKKIGSSSAEEVN